MKREKNLLRKPILHCECARVAMNYSNGLKPWQTVGMIDRVLIRRCISNSKFVLEHTSNGKFHVYRAHKQFVQFISQHTTHSSKSKMT